MADKFMSALKMEELMEVIADRTKLPLETVLKLKESKQSAPAL